MRPVSHRFNRVRFTLYAPIYDACIRRPFDRIRRVALGRLGLRAGSRVLVPGCGTGLDFRHLPVGVALTAGDLTPAMVPRARRAAQQAGHLTAQITAFDAARLPFASETFDVVVLHFLAAIAQDPAAVLREAARVLRPGGQVSLVDAFIARGSTPSGLRRALNRGSRLVATEIVLDAYPLAAQAGLAVVDDTPVLFGGLFRALRLRKPDQAARAPSSSATSASTSSGPVR